MTVNQAQRQTVAVVGSGVSGLTAAFLLQRRHDVTLFEQDPRLGGHAHTHELVDAAGGPVSVDSGFIVHNEKTYPNLLRLFADLGVRTQESEMSMSVSCQGCGLEYAGARGLSGLFANPSSLTNVKYLRMLVQVKKFHRHAHRVLADPADDDRTLAQFLAEGRYSSYFVSHFILPVVAAVWSCGPQTAGEYPAKYLFRFLEHHGLLSVTGSPTWRTVTGGSRTYVELAAKNLSAVQTAVPVRGVSRHNDGILIRTDDDETRPFDKVVIATHPNQALSLLTDAGPDETRVLGAMEYSASTTLLHTDTSVLPTQQRANASWNYRMSGCAGTDDKVHVTYDMNRLQRLTSASHYLVTLNSQDLIDPSSVIATMHYEHPMYTPTSVAAQAELPSLNSATTAFAGAYHGWGFHEDGCASGVRAAESFGGGW